MECEVGLCEIVWEIFAACSLFVPCSPVSGSVAGEP